MSSIQPEHPDFDQWKINEGFENLGNYPKGYARLRQMHAEERADWKQNEEALKNIIARVKADVRSRLNMTKITQNSLVGSMTEEKALVLIGYYLGWE